MAYFSQTSKTMKLHSLGDLIIVGGIVGKVRHVEIMRLVSGVKVQAVVKLGKDADTLTIVGLPEIEAIRYNGNWVNLAGEAVNGPVMADSHHAEDDEEEDDEEYEDED